MRGAALTSPVIWSSKGAAAAPSSSSSDKGCVNVLFVFFRPACKREGLVRLVSRIPPVHTAGVSWRQKHAACRRC